MKIQDLCKDYTVSGRRLKVLRHLDLDAEDRAITVVLGPSGCGKTTLLRLILGLEQPDRGAILPEGIHKTGFVFQEPRLMPWLTVEDNILFGAPKELRRKRSKARDALLERLLALTGLTGFEKAFPGQLSGGMQQRTSLARALAYGPDYLLMDEPFAALDHFTRIQMQQELLKIHSTEHVGVLFVTHSIDEALTIGDRIVILKDGACQKKYRMEHLPRPRDLLSPELVGIKRDILEHLDKAVSPPDSEQHNDRAIPDKRKEKSI